MCETGGLNALRDDIEESNKIRAEVQLKAMENLKSDFEKDLASFRIEMMALLQDLADDIKVMKQHQNEAGVTISGKHVAGAVKAVREIRRKGTSIFKSPKNKDED